MSYINSNQNNIFWRFHQDLRCFKQKQLTLQFLVIVRVIRCIPDEMLKSSYVYVSQDLTKNNPLHYIWNVLLLILIYMYRGILHKGTAVQ